MEGLADGKARITLIVACGASLCAGGLGGFLAARAQNKRNFEDRVSAEVSKEVEEVKRYYRDRLAVQVAEAEQRAAAAVADPGPGDHTDDGDTAVGDGPVPGISFGFRPGHTPYHRPPGIPASPASVLPDEDADASPGGGDPPEGLDDTGAQEDDGADFWPAEELADPGPEPDVPPVADGGLAPFIITRTDFHEAGEETGNQKVGITYYMGDGILADDKDVPIRDSAAIVGTDFLAGFGSADDPDIVYVRNNRVRIDFEIVRSLDGYAEHVLNYGKPQ